MPEPVEALVLDLLEWIGPQPRPYSEVIEAWRTSCPRLPVWEEATERGFVERQHLPGEGAFVTVTPRGSAFLREHRHRCTSPKAVSRA
jgi:D-3-phosphoglycerate dehydrogenase